MEMSETKVKEEKRARWSRLALACPELDSRALLFSLGSRFLFRRCFAVSVLFLLAAGHIVQHVCDAVDGWRLEAAIARAA